MVWTLFRLPQSLKILEKCPTFEICQKKLKVDSKKLFFVYFMNQEWPIKVDQIELKYDKSVRLFCKISLLRVQFSKVISHFFGLYSCVVLRVRWGRKPHVNFSPQRVVKLAGVFCDCAERKEAATDDDKRVWMHFKGGNFYPWNLIPCNWEWANKTFPYNQKEFAVEVN